MERRRVTGRGNGSGGGEGGEQERQNDGERVTPAPGAAMAGAKPGGMAPSVAATARNGTSMWLVWVVLGLYVAFVAVTIWQTSHCGYPRYDYRRSTAGCTVLKHGGVDDALSCYMVPPACLPPHVIKAVAPRVISDLAANGGPFWVWLPLLALAAVLRKSTEPSASATRQAAVLVTAATAQVFLAVSMWFRFTHVHGWLTHGFDPSGHVFVYTFCTIPLWFVGAQSWLSRTPLPAVWWVYAAVLQSWMLYGTATTTAFFHGVWEVSVPLLLAVGLMWYTQRVLQLLSGDGSTGGQDPAAAWRQITRAQPWVYAAMVTGCAWGVAAVLWRQAVAGGGAGSSSLWPTFALYLAYDALVIAMLVWLVRNHAPAGVGG